MKQLLYFLLMLTTMSCNKLFENEEFTFKRNNYSDLSFKTNGYYVSNNLKYPGLITDTTIVFFYMNGVVLFATPESLFKEDKMNNIKKIYYSWGIYQIKNDSIFIEYKFNSGQFYMSVYKFSGIVKNDSVLNITSVFSNSYGTNNFKSNLNFKDFSPKPDSTNVFIK
jgi:hypothetical protein